MPFVFVEESLAGLHEGDRCGLDGEERHHLSTVLRLGNGAQVEVSDGIGNVARARLFGGSVELIGPPGLVEALRPEVVLLQGVPKGRKLDEVVRVLTELGVDRIHLIDGKRSVARMDPRRQGGQITRLNAVARAASRQARRSREPVITPPCRIAELSSIDGVLAVAHPTDGAALRPVASLLAVADDVRETTTRLNVAIGPEGGWTEDEVEHLVKLGGQVVSLGPTVLRTEHAGAAAVAVLMAGLGRW